MSSINLSFKEWPFPSFNENASTDNLPVPPLKEKKTKSKLSLNITHNINPTLYSSNMDLSQPNIIAKSSTKIKNLDLPKPKIKPSKKKSTHLSEWGRCGLFACTFESSLSIFTNDNNGCLSPMFMLSPFAQFDKYKITNRVNESSYISAIGWANGYLQPSIAKPIFSVASEKGHLAIYDFNAKEIVCHHQFQEKIISLLWSAYKFNRFYVGSSTGHFYICEFENRRVLIKQTFDFYSYSPSTSENVLKPVDFITEEGVNGLRVAIASKDGSVGYIANTNENKKSKLQVFQQLPFNTCLGQSNSSNVTISFFEFYPNDQDFVIIATNKSTFLFSTLKGVLIPFIQAPNCKFVSVSENSSNQVIMGNGTSMSVWTLIDNSWVRSSITNFSGNLLITELLTFSKLKNKVLLTTASNWLTEIECRRSKIFITKRIKLLNKMPIDYDFGNGSIAFLLDDNSISFTSTTPESVIKPKFGFLTNLQSKSIQSKPNKKKVVKNHDLSDGSKLFTRVESSYDEEEAPIDYDYDSGEFSTHENKQNIGNNFIRSTSMTFPIDSDSSRALKEIIDKQTTDSLMITDIESPIPRSKSDLLGAKPNESDVKHDDISDNLNAEATCGNSNSISFSFKIENNSSIEQVFWVSTQKVIALSQNSLFVIDIQKRSIDEPLKAIFDSKCNIITQAFFTKSRKIMCIIFNHKTACFLNIEPNFEVINIINFSDIVKKDYNSLYGSLSPKEDQVVFAFKNFLYFAKIDKNEVFSMKEVFVNMEYNSSFVSWKNRGIIIGTENGSVFIISKKIVDDIFNLSEINKDDCTILQDSTRLVKRFGSVKLVSPCANNSFIIISSKGQGVILYGDVQQTINGKIKTLKLCNKDTFLVRFEGINRLIAMNAIGAFSPLPPPCFFANQTNNMCFNSDDMLNQLKLEKVNNDNYSVNSIIHHLFNIGNENPAKVLRNCARLLNQITSFHTPFNSLSLKTSLRLGDSEIARNLLLKTDPNDKDYLNNMMLAALFDTNLNNLSPIKKVQDESIQLAVKSLLSNDQINQAVDILLITKKYFAAAEILYNFGKSREAYQILMLGDQDNFKKINSDNIKELIQKIANSLTSKKENLLYGLKLLASFGYFSEMINLLSENL